MGDGRTDLFRNMWTRTTTNDTKGASYEAKLTNEYFDYSAERIDSQIKAMPNQRMHRIVSFVKSGFRIVGAFAGMFGYIPAAFGLFFLAEVVGIYEELV